MVYTMPRVLPKLLPWMTELLLLRLGKFQSATNGPDLYVYLATDKGVSDIVNLGQLKGNIGNQNYPIPDGTDLN